jgi:uncharacterized protein RhaS with RHS repeats
VLLTNRYYDPGTGRFLNRDPISYAGGMNLYGYAGNNPTTYADSSGLANKAEYIGGGALVGGTIFAPVGAPVAGAVLGGLVANGLYDSADDLGTTWGCWEGGYAPGWLVAWSGAKALGNVALAALLVHGVVTEVSAPQIKLGSSGGPTAGQRFSQQTKMEVIAENNTRTCVYCRQPGTGTQVDHAIPLSRAGNATLDNGQLTCTHCNASKGARDFPVTPPQGFRGTWPPAWFNGPFGGRAILAPPISDRR